MRTIKVDDEQIAAARLQIQADDDLGRLSDNYTAAVAEVRQGHAVEHEDALITHERDCD